MSAKIENILDSLKSIKGVHGSALIERFGLIKGQALPGWIDAEAVAAMVTLILKASQRATKELEQGEFNQAIIESKNGKIFFWPRPRNLNNAITSMCGFSPRSWVSTPRKKRWR